MSIRNYNAFLRAVRREHGITQKQAQAVYRRVSDRLGRAAKGVDARKHPRITGSEVKRVTSRRGVAVKGAKARGSQAKGRAGKVREITSLEDWYDAYEDAVDYDEQDVVSSADYGKKGK